MLDQRPGFPNLLPRVGETGRGQISARHSREERWTPSEKSHSWLARRERSPIERILKNGASYREIARKLGRVLSTVAGEASRRHFLHGAEGPSQGARDRGEARSLAPLPRQPWEAQGLRMLKEGARVPRCEGGTASRQRRGLVEQTKHRRDGGVRTTRPSAIRSDLVRALSRAGIDVRKREAGASRPTACRRMDSDYDKTANMEPRRKVAHEPRKRKRARGLQVGQARRLPRLPRRVL